MPFVYQLISDIGASTAVGARLMLQTHELLKSADLSDNIRENIFRTYMDLASRVSRCQKIAERISSDIDAEITKAEAADASERMLPSVLHLDRDVEDFLFQAKRALRDATVAPRLFFDAPLAEASDFWSKGKGDSKAVKWAMGTFGHDDYLPQFFRWYDPFLGELISRRNAVEHPGGHSGTLTIYNFQLETGAARVIPPTWETGGKRALLSADLRALAEIVLQFPEGRCHGNS